MQPPEDVSQNIEIGNFKKEIDLIADQLCLAVSGNFDFAIKTNSADDSIQKLSMLINFILDVAKRTLFSMKDQNAKLLQLNEQLKDSQALEILNRKLLTEIEERKKAQEKNLQLTNQLVISSRQAGMAETATSVLHNIGNVLNSVNTSISMIEEKITHSKMSNLEEINKLLVTNQNDIVKFITQDPKGKPLLNYMMKLSKIWDKDKNYLLEELIALHKNIQHIKDVITKQNSLSSLIGHIETVYVNKMIEDALMLIQPSESSQIKILCDFAPIRPIMLDRIKLLQVVINLIRNSIDSLLETAHQDKWIQLKTREKDHSCFIIQVVDNGAGILPENIRNIFSHGFTTKKTGHGFGLHSSAISIQEMGGNLSVESKGLNEGATFSIILPYEPIKNRGENDV